MNYENSGSFSVGSLFSFNRFITPVIVKVLYYIGLLAVLLSSISLLIASFAANSVTAIVAGVIWTIVSFILGVLAIRVFVEFLILLYDIREAVREQNRLLKNKQ